MPKVSELYGWAARQREKRKSRERDAARVAADERVENGLFDVLDRSKAKLVVRRRKIRVPTGG